MSDNNVDNHIKHRKIHRKELDQKLDVAGWGLFFLWVGLALLMDVGWGIGLIGASVITLGEQVARRYFDIKIEVFWIVVGLLFVTGGFLVVYEVEISLVPVLFIIIGIALLASLVGSRKEKG